MSQPAEPCHAPIQTTEDFPDPTFKPIGPARRGVLIVDHQNLIGLCRNQGLFSADPQWPLRLAQRVTNLERAVLVTDLAVSNPSTHVAYLHDMEAWWGNGYRIVHVPAKSQRVWDEESQTEKIRRRDMTGHGVRDEIELWRTMPGITDILLLTHDVDSAKDLQKAAWSDGKRVTLLTVGTDGIAYQLKQFADERSSILEYPTAYSFAQLERRRFWKIRGDAETMRRKLTALFEGEDGLRRYAYFRRQISDAKDLLQFLVDRRLLNPAQTTDATQLSWRLLRALMHDYLREEKLAARATLPPAPADSLERNQLESTERELAPAQTRACQTSLDEIIRIMSENGVLSHLSQTREGSNTIIKHFYVNTEHPAVQMLMALDIP